MSNFVIVPFQNQFHLVPDTDIALSLKKHCASYGNDLSYPTLAGAMEAGRGLEAAIQMRQGREWAVYAEK